MCNEAALESKKHLKWRNRFKVTVLKCLTGLLCSLSTALLCFFHALPFLKALSQHGLCFSLCSSSYIGN